MKDINIPKKYNGLIVTIKSVQENTTITCSKECFWARRSDGCSYFEELHRLGFYTTGKNINCISITVNVKNVAYSDEWYIGAQDIILVDNEGYTYKGIILCKDNLPKRISQDGTQILQKCQVDYIQLFPNIPDGNKLSKFIVDIGGTKVDFLMSGDVDTCNWEKDINITEETNLSTPDCQHNTYTNSVHQEFDIFKNRLRDLKIEIYSRLNNVLTENERIRVENKISNMSYALKLDLDLRSQHNSAFSPILDEYNSTIKDYQQAIKQEKEQTYLSRESILNKIDDLLNLSPRDFELYICSLFNYLGYDAKVTPYSNDQGLDVLMSKDGIKYGVQCKRYKANNTVGSPEIQTFLGAMAHAKVDKGIFITTSMFTFEAEKMAAKHPIRLINKIDLAKLILETLKQ